MVVVQKQDAYAPAIFTLLALLFVFLLLLLIGRLARGNGKARS
jgi:putative spermidine/putrescine transport system permease protein